jgi:hypothetical protein
MRVANPVGRREGSSFASLGHIRADWHRLQRDLSALLAAGQRRPGSPGTLGRNARYVVISRGLVAGRPRSSQCGSSWLARRTPIRDSLPW